MPSLGHRVGLCHRVNASENSTNENTSERIYAPPAPTLEIKSPIGLLAKNLANKPVQYGSIFMPEAAITAAILSAVTSCPSSCKMSAAYVHARSPDIFIALRAIPRSSTAMSVRSLNAFGAPERR